MYICDLDSNIKVIVLYVGYSSNEKMEFLQICINIYHRDKLKLTDLDDFDPIYMIDHRHS